MTNKLEITRELAERICRELEIGVGPGPRNRAQELRALLAADTCETCSGNGAVGNILNSEPCPDCTPVPPIIQTLHANGDLIAARATIAQQAQLIEQLKAGQRQGEPVEFQPRVKPWLLDCFGPVIAADRQERNHRFLEEALELVQACGATAGEAHQLVDYVYGRHIGDPVQEVGGVMVTLAALCLAHSLDMHAAGETELARIWTKVDQIRAKQAAKPAMSPLPGSYPNREQPAPVAVVLPERLTSAELEELEVIEVLLHGQGLSNLAGTMAAARQFIDEIVCIAASTPRALSLPKRKPVETLEFNWTTEDVENTGWNACLDKVKELNP